MTTIIDPKLNVFLASFDMHYPSRYSL